MHNTITGPRGSVVDYRERLSPSLWVLVGAAVVAPMAALVFTPIDATLALVAGIVVAVAVTSGLVLSSPSVSVAGGELRVGRAHIPVELLGDPSGATGEDARMQRGPGLSRTAWHLLRPGIDGLVRVPVDDPEDPVTEWVFSTRTPDRVCAAIRAAQRG
jgi:hypothetical protein